MPQTILAPPSIQVGKLRHHHTGSCVLRVSSGAYGEAVSGVQQDSAAHRQKGGEYSTQAWCWDLESAEQMRTIEEPGVPPILSRLLQGPRGPHALAAALQL